MSSKSSNSALDAQAAMQVRFFEHIKSNHPDGDKLGAQLMEILHLSQDSIYRRQSELGVEQKIVYSAKDIPIFYFFLFPELAVFKAFFFGKILWTNETFRDEAFDFDKIYGLMGTPREVLEQIGLALAKSYLQIPGAEVWNHSTINGHLYQVRYLWEAGQFANKESALSILSNTEKLLKHVQSQAEEGTKFLSPEKKEVGAESEFYFSEGIHLENAILQTKADQKKCYVLHNTGDYLITSDSAFCGRTNDYLNNVLTKSSLISKVGAKDRQRLFRNYSNKIDKLRRLIDGAD